MANTGEIQKWVYRVEPIFIPSPLVGVLTFASVGNEGWGAVCVLPRQFTSKEPLA
jgi:hypothetical protein